MNKNNIINDVCDCFKMNVNMKGLKQLEEYITDLQKKAELCEHYKCLYNKLKKQKDDVIELIKNNDFHCKNQYEQEEYDNELLRMLGETND